MNLTLATTSRPSTRPDTVPFLRLFRIEWRKGCDTRAARPPSAPSCAGRSHRSRGQAKHPTAHDRGW
jgi:hypothetical protein